tara:strand:- start:1522 stop:2166 length:645 start_codon:yes stop_codon:yes gene_type:complete
MSIDYTKIAGLTAEQIAELTDLHQTDVTNLIDNRDEIKLEKIGVQGRLKASEEALESARLAGIAAEELRLVDSGKYTEALALREKETIAAIAQANESASTAREALTSRDRGDVMNGVMGLIHDDHQWNSRAMLENMLEVGYNDQQQLTTAFKHNGEVVANGVSEFKSWAGEQESFKRILKGVDSSGAGTLQASGAGGAKLTLTQQSIAANKSQR